MRFSHPSWMLALVIFRVGGLLTRDSSGQMRPLSAAAARAMLIDQSKNEVSTNGERALASLAVLHFA